jgi:hypothetical protein
LTTVALVLAGAALALTTRAPAEEPKLTPERVKLVRATYRDAAPKILEIKEPIRVTQLNEQKEPRVIVLVVSDGNGATHDFRWWLDKGRTQNREFDRIYLERVGADGPLCLGVRGAEEAALYGLLLRYTERQEKAASLGAFEKDVLKEAQTVVARLDARFGGEAPVIQK